MASDRVSEATLLMTQFADRTGLTSERPRRRYLWTDAFAVCNFLGIARATGDDRYEALALRLVDQVHHELGRHRADDRRSGWIGGQADADGEAHPTRGGLRIGKPLPERGPAEPLDPDLEWDRDGQYFHYLTKWMHALDQVTRWTGRPIFNVWARELADAAHRAFTYGPRGAKRMAWKLSVDLSRPLVPSMGHHDPLDGYVTYRQLDATAVELGIAEGPRLELANADFLEMLEEGELVTSDPLGLGELLVDACRLAQLEQGRADEDLVALLLAAASMGLRHYMMEPDLRAPAERRLAFRELGLAIGLAGSSVLHEAIMQRFDAPARLGIVELARYLPLRTQIESFWLLPESRRNPTWLAHADINDVMLATSLAPDGFLVLPRGPTSRLAQDSHPSPAP